MRSSVNLESLGFEISGAEKYSPTDTARQDVGLIVEVSVPEWRRDVKITADLVEEIVRLYGYENITPTLPSRRLTNT